MQKVFEERGATCELIDLNSLLEEKSEEAAILVIRKGVDCLLQNTGFKTSHLM
jgi:hypothetical protein